RSCPAAHAPCDRQFESIRSRSPGLAGVVPVLVEWGAPMTKHACMFASIGIAVLVIALATPAAALAQSGPGTGSGGDCFLGICDPAAWLRDVVGQIVAGFLGGLISGIGGAITSFPNDVDFLLRTPEKLSYDNSTIQQFANASRALANGLLAVVALVGGFNVM